jgi:hypothetical protein
MILLCVDGTAGSVCTLSDPNRIYEVKKMLQTVYSEPVLLAVLGAALVGIAIFLRIIVPPHLNQHHKQ